MTDPKEEFKSSLAERLKEAGKRNMAITSPGDTGRDEAMENLAGAFADPVGDYVDERAAAAGAGVVSSDGTVDVAARVVDDRAYSDLSVARAVEVVSWSDSGSHADISTKSGNGFVLVENTNDSNAEVYVDYVSFSHRVGRTATQRKILSGGAVLFFATSDGTYPYQQVIGG